MKEVSYILLFDKDLITSSLLKISIYKDKPGSLFFDTSSTYMALELLDTIGRQRNSLGNQQEICLIVDLNMEGLEGYVFLASLQNYYIQCPVRVYVLNDETRADTSFPSLQHYHIAGRWDKPMELEVIESILNDHSPKYFNTKESRKVSHQVLQSCQSN